MKAISSYRLLVTPLSPVHIGTGESFEPTNYVIDDGILHEFDTGSAVAAMTADDRAGLLKITGARPAPQMIESLQRFFHDRRQVLMGHAAHRVPVLAGVASLYDKRVGRSANREADGGTVLNRLEIDRTAFNAVSRWPVLFGSSLKGAMRTALLDHVNDGSRAQQNETKGLHDFQGRLFGYRDAESGRLLLEQDPMRLVQLSDASWQGEGDVPGTKVYFAVNRKKSAVKDEQGRLRRGLAESGPPQILECVSEWQHRAFCGQLNLQSLDGIGERHAAKVPKRNRRFSAEQIARDCNGFYEPLLHLERAVLRERGFADKSWDAAVDELLSAACDRLASGQAFLLRVGRHSGAEAVTLRGVRNIKILKGGGQRPDYDKAARTLWLAADSVNQQTGLLPFGWVLVEIDPLERQAADWQELGRLCAPQATEARAVADRIAAKRAELEQARLAAERKRAAEEEQQQIKAKRDEQSRRDAEQREAQLAAMSDNMRRVAEFVEYARARVEQLRGAMQSPGGEIYARVRDLAKAAGEQDGWTPEEKAGAAAAIEEWLPQLVTVDMKDQRKKLKVNVLKGMA